MRKDEKLKTIYETIALHITRNENSWRDYLRFAATLYKYSFDNTLLIFAQNPNVTMLAPTAIWNRVGRYVNKGSTGIAVCEYENARILLLTEDMILSYHSFFLALQDAVHRNVDFPEET
ncbi:hypothetical protein [Acetivibrio cellulolyticus]|uniref:hypothetical protein n=1 Tax=Acetivibrio cellulolyticus TaxID=35830 RepID=UPI0001E2FB2A|nr:hypothetical protein [Acetivibrio cellulolyticus]